MRSHIPHCLNQLIANQKHINPSDFALLMLNSAHIITRTCTVYVNNCMPVFAAWCWMKELKKPRSASIFQENSRFSDDCHETGAMLLFLQLNIEVSWVVTLKIAKRNHTNFIQCEQYNKGRSWSKKPRTVWFEYQFHYKVWLKRLYLLCWHH